MAVCAIHERISVVLKLAFKVETQSEAHSRFERLRRIADNISSNRWNLLLGSEGWKQAACPMYETKPTRLLADGLAYVTARAACAPLHLASFLLALALPLSTSGRGTSWRSVLSQCISLRSLARVGTLTALSTGVELAMFRLQKGVGAYSDGLD